MGKGLRPVPKTARAAGIAAVVFVVFAAWLVGDWTQGTAVKVIDDVVFIVLTTVAAVGAAATARATHGRQRAAWTFLAFGLGGWAVGEMLWAYYELGLHRYPFPSPADAAYLIFPVGACLALLLLPSGHSFHSRSRLALDGLIVAGSLFAVSWVLVMDEVYAAGAENRLTLALSLAYPGSDLVVLIVAVLVLARAQTGQRVALTILTVGILCMVLSDSAFAYLSVRDDYASGSPIEIGWVAGLLLIAVATVAAREGADVPVAKQMPSWASIWLPYVPVLLGAVVTTVDPPSSFISSPVLPFAVVVIVAVLIRQFLVVSENRQLLATVAEQALLDPLTGVANYTLFHDRLKHAMRMRQVSDLSVAVLSLDLNDFKLVNDSLGHPAGDALLHRAARRILACVRTSDTVARVGGDEFAVLVEGSIQQVHLVAHRVVEAFDEAFVIDGQELLMRASVGLAVAAPDDMDLSAEKLLKQADMAMYSAKRSRIGGVHPFTSELQWADPVDTELSRQPERLPAASGAAMVRLLGELRQAIDRYDLTLVYQPKFDLRTTEIVGVEALLRWPHHDRGVLGPEEFLPLVRRHGLMGAATDLVLNKALDDAVRWQIAGVDVPIAVNLFAPSVADLKLPATITRALGVRRLRATALTVEITEDLFLDNIGRTQTVLHQLREGGIRIAIDDFGNGYSTLSYLRDLPIDEVKLDRHFIAPITVDPRAAAVVRAVVDLAHALGLTTVGEGVENAETAARLRDYGCDVAQGFYYSPPVSAAELLAMMRPATEIANPKLVPAAARSN